MKRVVLCGAMLASAWAPPRALADGGFIYRQGQAADLAQTRQEVVVAFYREGEGERAVDKALYVLRSRYTGMPPETFVWLVPVPATPSDVVAHQNDLLFEALDEETRPRFILDEPRFGGGCGCGPLAAGDGGRQGELVVIEAQGQSGIFDWAALTSTGAGALLDWLNENEFAVPKAAADVLATYIAQDMHFLAVRVREPDELTGNGDGEIAIPPIQFACQTSRRFYPMAISQISAAAQTEVLIYVLADHRAATANVANAIIDDGALALDDASPSLTNYEALFADTLAEHSGRALITEYAASWYGQAGWVTAPPAVLELGFLTRLRTVIAREHMVVDFEFQDAENDEWVYSTFWVTDADVAGLAAALGGPLVVLLLYAQFHAAIRRRKSIRGLFSRAAPVAPHRRQSESPTARFTRTKRFADRSHQIAAKKSRESVDSTRRL